MEVLVRDFFRVVDKRIGAKVAHAAKKRCEQAASYMIWWPDSAFLFTIMSTVRNLTKVTHGNLEDLCLVDDYDSFMERDSNTVYRHRGDCYGTSGET